MEKSKFLKKIISLVLVATLVICSGVMNVAKAEDVALADYSKLDKAIATIPDGPNRTNGVYKTEELEALDEMVESFDRSLTADDQAIVNAYRTDLLAAISALSMDLSKAEATVTVRIDRKLVKKDDIITVFININTNYPVTGIQLPVLYDKTQFTLVDYDSGNSYITFCDGSFKNGSYDLNGNAGLTTGFSNTSNSDKWNTEEAKNQYDYAFFTATFNSQKNPSNLNLAVPQNEDFATFRLQAKNDIENAEELVFISTDWIKNDTNKGGTFSVGFSGTVLNRNPLTYITSGMTYNLVTDSMIPTDSISLNITEATLTKDSPSVQLEATVTPETAINRKITWTSSDTSVATVDSTGKVTRVGSGETIIKAETPYGQIATCKITVIHQCFTEITLIKAKEAECYTQGNEKYYECTCGKYYSDSKAQNEVSAEDVIIPALNHPEDGRLEILGTDPTHTSDGEAGYWICGYCGDSFADYECTEKIDEPAILPATGHDDLTDKAWSSNKDSHYKQCSCGEKFEITPHTFEWIIKNEPTCADSGSKYEKCTVCGYVQSENTPVGVVPHTPELVEGTESTCTVQGNISYYECDVCSKLFRDEECADEITIEETKLPLAEHNFEWITDREPTCTDSGSKYEKCTVCGYVQSENTPVGVVPHTPELVEGAESTCTVQGNISYYECDVCSKLFKDEECTEEITKEDTKLPLAEHTFEWFTDREPTCTDSGSKYEKCTVCGYVQSENTPVGVVPHTPVLIEKVESTCIEQGSMAYYKCEVCSALFADEECLTKIKTEDTILPFSDHNYETVITPPTPTEQGFTTYTCSVCDYSYVSDYTGPGIKVGGVVVTCGFETDEVTLVLTRKGEDTPCNTLKLIGNRTEYCFSDVTPGDYVITVSKNNHMSQPFEFSVVDEEKITQNLEIYAFGDVNNDSAVNILDYTAILNHVKMVKSIDSEHLVYADINKDGRISVSDYAQLLRHVKKTHSIWQ